MSGWSFSVRNTTSSPMYCMTLTTAWLSIRRRVIYELYTIVYRCLHSVVQSYLTQMCQPVSNVSRRIAVYFFDPRWSGCPTNRNVNVRTTEFCSVGANKLELTTSIVPWRIPDTRTIPTQTENVAVPFVLRPWFDCALLARHNADQATLQAKNSVYPIAKATEFTAHAQYHVTCL